MANPDWTRDELILALDLYFREPAARGSKSHPQCSNLSTLLNRLPIHAGQPHDATFRNANGVGMKLSNFLKFDPTYTGKGLSAGSHLEEEVWKTFANDRPLLRKVAAAIAANAKELFDAGVRLGDEDEEEDSAEEGQLLLAAHKRRERNRALVTRRKIAALKATGKLACEVCTFDFHDQYGDVGRGFAECHHDVPLATLTPGQKTRSTDLRIVCANCHRMLHRSRPHLSVEALRARLKG
jgi:5-methylcytosine-specific restriction protein A